MHRRCATLIVLACLMAAVPAPAAPKKALFDNTHAETAGNADWQIDTDQPVPSPAQSGITWATPRTIWLGAISSWAVDLVKRGYEVATLTTAFGISYGNAGNLYDLSKYDVFIVDEPNTRFTSAESTAIFDYVRDGGGLVAVADHANSDRNGDGVDSPKAWGRLDRQHLFGAHFDSTGEANNNFSQDSGNVDTSPTNPIVHGVNGVGDSLSFHGGTSLTLFPAANPNVRGDVWMNGLAHGNSGVMAAHSTYGLGRIFFVGDSSPCDDGSAAPGNSNIFDGWAEVSGRDSLLFMNGTMWVTRQSVDAIPPAVTVTSPDGGESWAVGSTHAVTWTATDAGGVDSVNVDYSLHGSAGPWLPVQHGLANGGSYSWTIPAPESDSALVRVTAWDPTGNAGSDAGNALFQIGPDLSGAPEGNGGVASFAVGPPTPNPSRSAVLIRFSLARSGSAGVQVLDAAGRLIRRFGAENLPAGEHSLVWDGLDESGRPTVPGVYFARVVTGLESRTVRLVRLR